MTSLSHTTDLAPPPEVGAEVWLEDLVGGLMASINRQRGHNPARI